MFQQPSPTSITRRRTLQTSFSEYGCSSALVSATAAHTAKRGGSFPPAGRRSSLCQHIAIPVLSTAFPLSALQPAGLSQSGSGCRPEPGPAFRQTRRILLGPLRPGLSDGVAEVPAVPAQSLPVSAEVLARLSTLFLLKLLLERADRRALPLLRLLLASMRGFPGGPGAGIERPTSAFRSWSRLRHYLPAAPGWRQGRHQGFCPRLHRIGTRCLWPGLLLLPR